MDLFELDNHSQETHPSEPLAVRMRPERLDDFVGQDHILGLDRLLRRTIIADRLSSLIVWGPPGCGKTSLAHIISKNTGAVFVYLNGSFCAAADIKKEISSAHMRTQRGLKTVLFVDEIHRLNRLQQDILIPDTESLKIILIGATTYNPFFYINPALISRSLVCEFKPLSIEHIIELMRKALEDQERGLGAHGARVSDEALLFLAQTSSGDARRALNSLELGVVTTPADKKGTVEITLKVAKETVQLRPAFYDQKGDYHYDVISAFIKSVRGSDPDAALYWLSRMLFSGEDPRFIARRLIILASEDIGLADPFALVLATSCFQAVEYVGMPEAKLMLSEATLYLAQAQKSNSSYEAITRAWADVETKPLEEVPLHLKDSHYASAKKSGRGKDYLYPHDFGGYIDQEYRVSKKKYYFPKDIGKEAQLHKNMQRFKGQSPDIQRDE